MKKGFKFDKDKLIEALSKRAQGFFYSEEVFEYGEASKEQTASKPHKSKKDVDDFSDEENELEKNISEKIVSKIDGFENHDIYSGREKRAGEDELTCGSQIENNENTKKLILLKKKVTTHYIPPDLAAVKMLYEIAGEEVGMSNNNIIESLSDEELLKMKNELIKEIKNEDK